MERSDPETTRIENPIIFIVGSTASGKTKLSVELGRVFSNIEIVNADAMQLYQGADIMTAKATINEQAQVKHHLLDVLPMEQLDFTRKDYCEIATKKISELHSNQKVPLVVGGTTYFIEAVLFNDYDITDNMKTEDLEKFFDQNFAAQDKKEEEEISAHDPIFNNWMNKSTKQKLEILSKVDPLMAQKIHPNDLKRIENYIKMYLEENIIPSKKVIALNNLRKLRYPNSIIFWVKDENKENLKNRIEKRIKEMMNIDGIREIIRVYGYLESKGSFNFTKGVLQSIGYKEFYTFYLKLKDKASEVKEDPLKYIANIEIGEMTDDLLSVLEENKEQLISSTIQYAKRQITFIKNRLFESKNLDSHIFLLEFSQSSKFDDEVVEKAKKLTASFMDGEMKFLVHESLNEKHQDWKKFYCEVCESNFMGQNSWDEHIQSRRHKKSKEGKVRHEKNMELKEKYNKNNLILNQKV